MKSGSSIDIEGEVDGSGRQRPVVYFLTGSTCLCVSVCICCIYFICIDIVMEVLNTK